MERNLGDTDVRKLILTVIGVSGLLCLVVMGCNHRRETAIFDVDGPAGGRKPVAEVALGLAGSAAGQEGRLPDVAVNETEQRLIASLRRDRPEVRDALPPADPDPIVVKPVQFWSRPAQPLKTTSAGDDVAAMATAPASAAVVQEPAPAIVIKPITADVSPARRLLDAEVARAKVETRSAQSTPVEPELPEPADSVEVPADGVMLADLDTILALQDSAGTNAADLSRDLPEMLPAVPEAVVADLPAATEAPAAVVAEDVIEAANAGAWAASDVATEAEFAPEAPTAVAVAPELMDVPAVLAAEAGQPALAPADGTPLQETPTEEPGLTMEIPGLPSTGAVAAVGGSDEPAAAAVSADAEVSAAGELDGEAIAAGPGEEAAQAPADGWAESVPADGARAPLEPAGRPLQTELRPMTEAEELAARERLIEENRRMEAQAKFLAGLELYRNQLFPDAARAFEEALTFNPDHAEAREYLRRTRGILGETGDDTDDRLIQEITERESARLQAVQMRLRADLEEAQRLYLRSVTPDETRRLLPFLEQIAEALGDLDRATEKLRQVDSVVGTSPLATDAQREVRLQVQALRLQIDEARQGLLESREKYEREAAQRAAAEAARETRSNFNRRMENLLQSARYFFERNEFEKARQMAEEILRMDPRNADAMALRNRAQAAYLKKTQLKNETMLHDSEVNWSLDVRQAAILPSEDLIYPENWEQIKMRVRREREMVAGSEIERQIRERLASTRISVEWVEQPLREVLRYIQEIGRVNIVADTSVDEDLPVTLTVTDMALDKALNWVMDLSSYHYEIRSEAIYVSQQPRRSAILQIYPVYDLTRAMEEFLPDDDEEFEEEDEDEEDLDAIAFVDIRDRIINTIDGDWDNPGVSIEVWEDNLIVMQTPEVHSQIVTYLNRLREFSKQQVLVDGRFLDVTDDLLEEIGISWADQRQLPATDIVPNSSAGLRNWKADDGRTLDTGFSIRPGIGQAGGATTNFGLDLLLGYISSEPLRQFEVDMVLHALNEKRRGSVMHNPRLLVANGLNAYLEVRTLTNYVANWEQQGDIFQPVIEQYEQGITWSVRPVISYDRKYITIRVRPRLTSFDPENSRNESQVRATVVGGTDGERIWDVVTLPFLLPVTRITQLESYVTLPDGGVVLMGGLIQDERLEAISGVPLLSSVPFVGRLARSERRSYDKKNLVVMVQGRIVTLDE